MSVPAFVVRLCLSVTFTQRGESVFKMDFLCAAQFTDQGSGRAHTSGKHVKRRRCTEKIATPVT